MELIPDTYVLFAARLVLGAVMVYYGRQKIFSLRSNAKDFAMMGFRPAGLWGTVVAFNEFFGGLAMLLGIIPEVFAATFGFQMLMGTMWKLKIRKPFSDYSYDIMAFVLAAFIMMYGAGAFVLLPFTYIAILRIDFVIVAVVVSLIGAALSRPKMKRRQ